MSFLAELKRRKVIRVSIAYMVGAWLGHARPGNADGYSGLCRFT